MDLATMPLPNADLSDEDEHLAAGNDIKDIAFFLSSYININHHNHIVKRNSTI